MAPRKRRPTLETITDRTIEEIRCDSWVDFHVVLRDQVYKNRTFVEGDFLFRGQSSPRYRLTSSFDRWYKGPRERRPFAAQQLMTAFRTECEADPEIDQSILQDDDRLRGLAQHNGLPTRLLDWTVSPYVAAFFAFSYTFSEDVVLEDEVAIWVLDPDSHIWTAQNGAYVISPARHGNDRLRSQGGRFTHLVGAYDSLEEYVLSFDAPGVLRKLVISTNDISYALADLKAMQVDHSRLFPGVQGYAMDAKTRVGIEQQITPQDGTGEHPSRRAADL